MRSVKSRDSKIEVVFRKALWKHGFRYRKNVKVYFGKPDLVLKKYKSVIFIDSCFWHGCKNHCRIPATNREYWINKISKNIQRDIEVNRKYQSMGWMVLRFWEHDITKNLDDTIRTTINMLTHTDVN